MKIAIDIRNIGKGRTGDEVVFFNLVKNLAVIDSINQYVLLTDRNPQKDHSLLASIEKMQLKSNFSIIHLCENGANKFLWNAWVLPQYLKKNPVDILQTQYITPFFVSRKIKIITIIHDVSFMAYPGLIKWTDLFFLKNLIPMSIRRADKVIGVSKFTAEEIVKYYKTDSKKIEWIYNAVGENFHDKIPQDKLVEVKKKYDLPSKFILYVGTLQPRKNLPALIEAYIRIPIGKREGLGLVLAGGKGHNFDQRIEEYIENYSLQKHVLLPGYIDEADKPALFKLAHVFCFPSLYEGFGIPILEAMTVGVPSIVSEIPPHIEVCGDSGLFFDIRNTDDFAKKLTDIVSDEALRSRLKETEKAQAEKFSWKGTAQKMLEIYEKIGHEAK